MKIHEIRKITSTDLRALCIKKDWYTYGDNSEYSNLLHMTEEEMDVPTLAKVASDIIKHSDPKCFDMCTENGINPMEYVMFELCDISKSVFHIL